MKKNFCFVIFFTAFLAAAFCKTAKFSGEDYVISAQYNEKVFPGDAVFVRMSFESKNKKKTFASARAEIFNQKKAAAKSPFYILSAKKNSAELLSGMPLSSWAEVGEYELRITYNISGEGEKNFSLPLSVQKKEFERGVITLNQTMQNISSDTSLEKVEQSKRLNAIINSVNAENVFNLKKFVLPVISKRRTTQFAERIVYKYPSGKESTTVHAGIDFGLPVQGSKVHMEIAACAEGKVVLAEDRISTGLTIVIEHLPGLYSMYFHMSELKVKTGQMVKAGELMGYSGTTGFSTGEHLHWEVRLNSMIVNPDFFVQNNFAFEEE